MQPFTQINGIVVPIDRANVDTDAIIPKQYLKSIGKTGFGPNLFDDWRYLDPGEPYMDHCTRRINAGFVLNQPRYHGASILLARDNYGCGSSREHAVWAMVDYGIRVVIAPSFADIFYNNTLNNGLLAITLDSPIVDRLFAEVEGKEGYALKVDLEARTITTPWGEVIDFTTEEYRRKRLLAGLDDIGMTLLHTGAIRAYEAKRKEVAPWLF
nr:3-isopropylmalate dehydratase small subunit [uncultured Desulfobulbus sp.]